MRYLLVSVMLLVFGATPIFADDGGGELKSSDGSPVIVVADDGGGDLKTRDGLSPWDVIVADDGGGD